MARFNQAKNFKVTKNLNLASEFFKHPGHFTDEDLKVFVQRLLEKTPDWVCAYPKVTVHKTVKLHHTHYSAMEWVDRKKKKMIVLQQLDDLDCTLHFALCSSSEQTGRFVLRPQVLYLLLQHPHHHLCL
jgi:hypothetical protein